jgi:hypothetical protein
VANHKAKKVRAKKVYRCQRKHFPFGIFGKAGNKVMQNVAQHGANRATDKDQASHSPVG